MDIVARLGGDQFALLLPETGASDAATLFGDLQKQLQSSSPERAGRLGLSIGAVTFNSVPGSLDDALGEADTLLYEAKHPGKGRLRHATWPRDS